MPSNPRVVLCDKFEQDVPPNVFMCGNTTVLFLKVSGKMVFHLQYFRMAVIPKAPSRVPYLFSPSLLLLGLTVRNDTVSFHSYADDTQLYLQILPILMCWTHQK